MIEMPRVKILNGLFETPDRQFPVGTALQLTCKGEVGNDPRKVCISTCPCIEALINRDIRLKVLLKITLVSFQTIKWCAQKANEWSYTGLPKTPIHSEASPSGCQYTRSSTITYNLSKEDTFTQFLCESGDTGFCGTGTAIQHIKINITG